MSTKEQLTCEYINYRSKSADCLYEFVYDDEKFLKVVAEIDAGISQIEDKDLT